MIIDDKLMKYVLFKKRTEKEVRQKCDRLEYTKEYTDEIIDYLIENRYIDDVLYVEKHIKNIMMLKISSVYEIRMDLLKRGIPQEYIDSYMNTHIEELNDFENESARKLAIKKYKSMDVEKIRRHMISKGYAYSNIADAIDNLEDLNDN
ncbi:MAG: RecX family transcriptional regulator [Clostridia bacterium]|nr:RecX family transcriptional regulator [Clostridia bacterium]